MNKNIIIGLVAAVLILPIAYFALAQNDETDEPEINNSNTVVEDNPTENNISTEKPVADSGEYVEYSQSVIAENTGKNKVLFFHAVWCSICNSIERNIEAGSIPDDLVIIKVDFDSEQDLRQQYEVTTQYTFVEIDDEGNFVQKWFGNYDTDAQDIQDQLI